MINDWAMLPENLKRLLLEHNVRPTAQRLEIGKILFSCMQHLSADQVLSRVNNSEPVVSKATVYNTLNLFVEKGLIRQVIIDPGKVFYDSNTTLHHHFYHEDTGMVEDIDANRMTISNMPELPPDTVKTGVDVVIRIKNKK